MAQRLGIARNLIRSISRQATSGNRAKAAGQIESAPERTLYDRKLLKKHYEIIPLLVIVLGGIGVLSAFIFRNTVTRDDVRFRTKGKFGYEEEDNLDRQRKFLVYNQKYKAPEGLKELYEELKEE